MTHRTGILDGARSALLRQIGDRANDIRMSMIPADGGRDVYEVEAVDGVLTLRGSSPVALCRGFYDYAKAHDMGMVAWVEGHHLRIPERWPETPKIREATPYAIRQAYNVVTSGYTFPFWGWARWERELDWQAMHGFNMLLVPIGFEAIMDRVWLRQGLTVEELLEDSCGPAHLPWHRMGNICGGIGGRLPKAWHAGQVALQHKILARMRELGMEPLVQSFSGFVPRAVMRIHPETVLHDTLWNGAYPPENRPKLLLPDQPLFGEISASFMKEWQQEFGPATYFLVDSFNELKVPETERPMTESLAAYGEGTWKAIQRGAADAVWVVQGWTFGYQHWSTDHLKALFSKVPDERVLVLDYANDYYAGNWEQRFSDSHGAFFGKSWAFGYVPNMGGKTPYTGDLDFYATASARMLASEKRGRIVGFTLSGEGLENNELVYELITDMAWRSEAIDLDSWIPGYCRNRYGACPPAVAEAWALLRRGCYSGLTPHPRFSWQGGGAIDRSPNLVTAAELFLSAANELGTHILYRADAVEMAALALSLKADEWLETANIAFNAGDMALFDLVSAQVLERLDRVDRLMEAHPYHRLQRWIDLARAQGDTPELKDAYEASARTIVTYWGPGVNDYSARVWGGLVRDYYRERLRQDFEARREGKPFNQQAFMIDYTEGTGVTPFTPCVDAVSDAKAWVSEAATEALPVVPDIRDGDSVASWTPSTVTTTWQTMEWPVSLEQLKGLVCVCFAYTRGNHRLVIRRVALIADGNEVAADEHMGHAGKPNHLNVYRLDVPADVRGNNGCVIRAEVRGGGGNNSYGNVILQRQDLLPRPYPPPERRFLIHQRATCMSLSSEALSSMQAAVNEGFRDGETVCFLGDSIIHGGLFHRFIYDYYLTRFPDRTIRFVNAGVAGDSAGGVQGRLTEDVTDNNPTSVAIMFGMNDVNRSAYVTQPNAEQKAAQQAALDRFMNNMDALIGRLRHEANEPHLLFLTPSPFDQTVINDANNNQPGCNDGLGRCAEIVRTLAATHNGLVVDFNGPMTAFNLQRQRVDPTYSIVGPDRVHPGMAGHLMMACLFLKAQGAPALVSQVVLDASTGQITSCANATVSQITNKAGLWEFTVLEQALPFPIDDSVKAELSLLPIEQELNLETLSISGLERGNYELLIDGNSVGRYSADLLAQGINLAFNTATPQYRQATVVAKLNETRRSTEFNLRNYAAVRRFLKNHQVNPDDFSAVDVFAKTKMNKTGYFEGMVPDYLASWPKRGALIARITELEQQLFAARRPVSHTYLLRPAR